MKVTKISAMEAKKPAYGFQLDNFQTEGFWRIRPEKIEYGVHAEELTASDSFDGKQFPFWNLTDWNASVNPLALYVGISLKQVQATQGCWRAPLDVSILTGVRNLAKESFSVPFVDGFGFLGFQRLPLLDGQMRVELESEKAPLFTIQIPVVKGLPTAEAGVKPGSKPVLTKRIEHDDKGLISKIFEGDVVKLVLK